MELCSRKCYFSFRIISFLFFTIAQFMGVLGKFEYNTQPNTPASRATKHVPKVVAKTCLLLPQHGPCRANIKMYYYNTAQKNCTTFEWGGCQGNGNRFDSHNECISTCLSKPNMRGQKCLRTDCNIKTKSLRCGRTTTSRPRFCELTFDYGYCFGASKRWYYDKLWKVCKETIYSGCGGNQNNFYSLNKCEEVCRFEGFSKTLTSTTGSIKKYLIINPPDATSARGLVQTVAKAVTTAPKHNDDNGINETNGITGT